MIMFEPESFVSRQPIHHLAGGRQSGAVQVAGSAGEVDEIVELVPSESEGIQAGVESGAVRTAGCGPVERGRLTPRDRGDSRQRYRFGRFPQFAMGQGQGPGRPTFVKRRRAGVGSFDKTDSAPHAASPRGRLPRLTTILLS
jgi:hypothetical protein